MDYVRSNKSAGIILWLNWNHFMVEEIHFMVEPTGKLRRQGITEIEQMKEAHVETDGQISVVRREAK